MKEKFYITSAIAYSSRKPHIGNTYEVILTDAIARYKRQHGYDVFFLTGTDEHGQKIQHYAEEAGISPKEYVDGVAGEIQRICDIVGVSYDKFIRTTNDYHVSAVQHIFKKFYDKGDIYKGYYEGWYCEPCESFLTDTQVVDGKCPDCGRPVKRTKEEAYFFRMSAYQDWLLNYIEDHPDFIEPESRKKEMVNNFLKAGLQDLCLSRTSFTWGIPVDFDPKHVIYVWLDALANYITALGYDPNKEESELFKKYWPADVHIIGKDIMRFHSIYWTIFLKALDLPLPKKIFGHPWMLFGNDKMSKSKGNVMYADDLIDLFGLDAIRFYVLSEMPYAQDGSITYDTIVERYNSELANNLGNLVSRTLAMINKYFGGQIPQATENVDTDEDLKSVISEMALKSERDMDDYRIADAIADIFAIFKRANKYIDETSPWLLAKNEESRSRLGGVLYNLAEAIRIGAVYLTPFMPETSASILRQLGTDVTTTNFGGLISGGNIGESSMLFARLDEKEISEKIEALNKASAKEKAPEKPSDAEAEIEIDSFKNVEMRSALIIDCEPVPKAKKLLKIQLDLGYEKRQVVSGIAEFYKPEELIGKKVIVIANLKPAMLRGVESNGMILASGEEKVRVVFLADDTPLGERIR